MHPIVLVLALEVSSVQRSVNNIILINYVVIIDIYLPQKYELVSRITISNH